MTFTLFKKVTFVYFVVPPDLSEITRASLEDERAFDKIVEDLVHRPNPIFMSVICYDGTKRLKTDRTGFTHSWRKTRSRSGSPLCSAIRGTRLCQRPLFRRQSSFRFPKAGKKRLGERHTWINSTISTDLSTVYYRYDSTFNTGSFSAISISTIKHCPFPVDGMLDRCNSLSDNDRYLIIDEEVRAVDPPRIASPCSRKPLDLDKIIGSSNRKQQSP
jgi:hypothetical protein